MLARACFLETAKGANVFTVLELIAGFLCDWFWLLEIIFGVAASLIENSMLRHNLEKIQKQEVNFIVGRVDAEPGTPAEGD